MQLYFVKATYTNNVYKLSDFFLSGSYKLVAGKMIDINFRPDDGISSFITKHIVLPDSSLIREHTHIIVPEFNKIYRISAIDYVNIEQVMVVLDEDPLIGNYIELEATDILINRSNDSDVFRGVNDIADLTLQESVVTIPIFQPAVHSGKWALLFFQYNADDPRIGLRFNNVVTKTQHIVEGTLNDLLAGYPEITTDEPELVDYFQEIAYVIDTGITYQCIWRVNQLVWAVYVETASDTVYINASAAIVDPFGVNPIKVNKTDVLTYCLALPFETDLVGVAFDERSILSYDKFIGPIDASLIDIKIVNDVVLRKKSMVHSWNPTTRVSSKSIAFDEGSSRVINTYTDVATSILNTQNMLTFSSFHSDIDVKFPNTPASLSPFDAEPYIKYDLYIFGKKYNIPRLLINDIRLLIAINSGVINYLVYFEDKRNLLASGSFTHSIKYQIDGLDAFYSQNPTYKDQFFTKMATDSIKTIAGGAIGGSVIPGVGTLAGAGIGAVGAGVDAGLGLINLHYQEKSLRMKPDQAFGENSDVTLQEINIFGVYWVKRTSSNKDLMMQEYSLRGFPTAIAKKINELTYSLGGIDASLSYTGLSKVVYGELKKVIKNEYTTAFINQKLKEGIIFIA